MIKLMQLYPAKGVRHQRNTPSFDALMQIEKNSNKHVAADVLSNLVPFIQYEHIANVLTDDVNLAHKYITPTSAASWNGPHNPHVEMVGNPDYQGEAPYFGDILITENNEHFMIGRNGLISVDVNSHGLSTNYQFDFFTLTSLQMAAFNMYEYTPEEVIDYAEALHKKGFITNPMTEVSTLPSSMRDAVISMMSIGDRKAEINESIFSDDTNEKLHGIIPTNVSAAKYISSPLSEGELYIFNLISHRFADVIKVAPELKKAQAPKMN